MPRIAYEPRSFRPAHEALIVTAEQICRDYGRRGYQLTLRQLYYQFVARAIIENTERSYKNLGNLISKARRAGRIDWLDIADRGRFVVTAPSWTSPAQIIATAANGFQYDLWERTNQTFRPQVWVEKDALSDIVRQACDGNRVPYMACRGYPSDSVLWGVAQTMMRQEQRGLTPLVLHLGDHDPSGIDMTRDLQDRINLFGTKAEVHRIALTMDQVEQHEPPPNPAKVTDARFEGYREIYGDESWELDALPPDILDDLIKSELEPYIDMHAWQDGEDEEETERENLRRIVTRWDDVVSLVAE